MGTVADAWRAPAVTGPVGSDAPVPATPGMPAATPAPAPSVPVTGLPSPAPSSPVVRDPDAAAKAAAAALLATRPDVLAARAAVRASRLGHGRGARAPRGGGPGRRRRQGQGQAQPGRVAGAAAGIGFLAVGGPRKVIRRARYAVFGKPDPLPEAMLPDEIEKALKALGPDGAKVRGALERDFADYVARTEKRKDRRSTVLFLLLPTVRILILRFGKQFIEEVLSTRGGFEEQVARVRARYAERQGRPAAGPLAGRSVGGSPLGPEPAARCATLAGGRVAEWQTRRP